MYRVHEFYDDNSSRIKVEVFISIDITEGLKIWRGGGESFNTEKLLHSLGSTSIKIITLELNSLDIKRYLDVQCSWEVPQKSFFPD